MLLKRLLILCGIVGFAVACETTQDASSNFVSSSSEISPNQLRLISEGGSDRVFFSFDQYTLSAESRQILNNQVVFFKNNPSLNIVVEGHADERGSREYNIALGERRASEVRKYLKASGIPEDQIYTVSYGKEKPICQESNDACWGSNRRSVVIPK